MTTARRRGVENKPYIEAMRGLRRSSASGTHDSRPRRMRSREASRRAAVRDQRD